MSIKKFRIIKGRFEFAPIEWLDFYETTSIGIEYLRNLKMIRIFILWWEVTIWLDKNVEAYRKSTS